MHSKINKYRKRRLYTRVSTSIFLLFLSVLLIPSVTFALSHDGNGVGAGTGGGYSSGGSVGSGDIGNTTGFVSAVGMTDTVSIGGVSGGYTVGVNNDGSLGLSGTFGGNSEVTNPLLLSFLSPTCGSVADLTAVSISFAYVDTPSVYLPVSDLDVGTEYAPSVAVTNTDCVSTNEGTVGVNYLNQSPIGQNGTFPVRLQLDFDKDGNIDYDETVNGVGPLGAGLTTVIIFPTFTIPSIIGAGAHEAVATVDPVGTPEGCSGEWGCVKELVETNVLTQPFSTTIPILSLGSSLYVISTYSINPPLSTEPQREVTTGEEIALLWSGTKINFASCTGTATSGDGSILTDFNGSNQGTISVNSTGFSVAGYDTSITEPTSGNFNVYTLTCVTTSGKTMSDTHILNNGGDTSTFTKLIPSPTNVTIEKGSTLNRYQYDIKNEGRTDITEYEYTLEINGEGLITDEIEDTRILVSGDSHRYNDTVNWSSSIIGDYIAKVCVAKVNGSGGRGCREGIISVVEPSISSGVIAPTISATPSLVRVGDTVEVTWDEGTDTGCTLSPQRFDAFVNDNGGTSPVDFPVTGGMILRITCDTTSDSAEVRVLPAIYEI